MLKWIIFDLDDTLIPSSHIYETVLSSLFSDLSAYRAARKKVKNLLPKNYPSSHNRLLYFKTMLESMSPTFTTGECLALMKTYEERMVSEVTEFWSHSKNGNTLKKLAQKYKLAILTNENLRTQLLKLNAIDPNGEVFSWILTSEEVGCEKPCPEIFAAAIARTGVSPAEICFVGDSHTDDIQPATIHGMKAIRTFEWCPSEQPNLKQKMETIENLEQLFDVLITY